MITRRPVARTRAVWLLALAGCLLCLASAASADDTLIARAKRVYSPIVWDSYFWLTDTKLLLFRGSRPDGYTYIIRDTTTGHERVSRVLTKHYEDWNHDHPTASPDGRRLLWYNPGDDGDHGVVADLATNRRTEALVGNCHEQSYWMPDSRRWLDCTGLPYGTAAIRWADAPDRKRTMQVPPPLQELWGSYNTRVVSKDTVVTVEATPYRHPTAVEVAVARLASTVRMVRHTKYRIRLTGEVYGYDLSPDGRRIAWTLTSDLPGGCRRCSVWITSVDGTHRREVGHVDIEPKDSDDGRFDAVAAEWLPSGKGLGLCFREALYTLRLK